MSIRYSKYFVHLCSRHVSLAMTTASYLTSIYLKWFAQPKCDRTLFRRIQRFKPLRIVEIGLGDGARGCRAIELAQRYTQTPLSYCGIDLFETRSSGASLTLKKAHHRLSQTGAKIRLVPGDALSALASSANFLVGTDLLIIDDSISSEDIIKAQGYLPRIQHPKTSVARYETVNGVHRIHWLKPGGFSHVGRPAA